MPRATLPPWRQFQQESAKIRRGLEGLVRSLETLAGDKEHTDAISGSDAIRSEIAAWEQSAETAIIRARELFDKLLRSRGEQISTMSERLVRVLKARGHDVYGEAWPLIVDGVVHVESIPEQGMVRVNEESVQTFAIPELIERIEAESARMKKLATAPVSLLEQLQMAYDEECVLRRLVSGAQVETLTILFRLAMSRQPTGFRRNPAAKSYREYTREQFRADFFNLLKSGSLSLHGRRLRYASGSDTTGAVFMLVPPLGRTAHIGRIWFEAAGDGA